MSLSTPESVQKLQAALLRIPVMWAGDYGDVGQSRSEATLVVFLH
jgi:hypothetical protein